MCTNAPEYVEEADLLRLLRPFGALKLFKLLRDGGGKSRGSFVFVYDDEAVRRCEFWEHAIPRMRFRACDSARVFSCFTPLPVLGMAAATAKTRNPDILR